MCCVSSGFLPLCHCVSVLTVVKFSCIDGITVQCYCSSEIELFFGDSIMVYKLH